MTAAALTAAITANSVPGESSCSTRSRDALPTRIRTKN